MSATYINKYSDSAAYAADASARAALGKSTVSLEASSGQAWTDWKNVDSVTHAANATTAANYITDQSTTVSIHSKFTSVDSQIYDISNYKKIRVVNNLPSSPDSDTIYFI